jgi:hypothetical protein
MYQVPPPKERKGREGRKEANANRGVSASSAFSALTQPRRRHKGNVLVLEGFLNFVSCVSFVFPYVASPSISVNIPADARILTPEPMKRVEDTVASSDGQRVCST